MFSLGQGSIEGCVFRVCDTRRQDMTSLTTGKILDDHYEERKNTGADMIDERVLV